MRRPVKHPLAERDLIDIWHYTCARWSEAQADAYLRKINVAIERLSGNPGLGIDYSHLLPGLRRYTIGHHRIFYRCDADALRILRVFHEKMDVTGRFPSNDLTDD